MRQHKHSCVYMMILLGADTTIANAAGERPDEMCLKYYGGKTIINMEFEAVRVIMSRLKPKVLLVHP